MGSEMCIRDRATIVHVSDIDGSGFFMFLPLLSGVKDEAEGKWDVTSCSLAVEQWRTYQTGNPQ